MASLYEIEQSMLDCVDMETGEVIDAEKLDALQMEHTKKLESIALWIKNLESDVEAYKVEMESFAARRRAAERKVEGLKAYLSNVLHGQKFNTTRCAVSFRKSQSVEIDDEEEFRVWAIYNSPSLLVAQEPKISRVEVKAQLKEGMQIPGAALVEKLNINIK